MDRKGKDSPYFSNEELHEWASAMEFYINRAGDSLRSASEETRTAGIRKLRMDILNWAFEGNISMIATNDFVKILRQACKIDDITDFSLDEWTSYQTSKSAVSGETKQRKRQN